MRLLVFLSLALAVLCNANGLFKPVSPTPATREWYLGATNTIALLLRKEYVRALTIINTIYCPSHPFFSFPDNSTDKPPQRRRRTHLPSYGPHISSLTAHFTSPILQAMGTNILSVATVRPSPNLPTKFLPFQSSPNHLREIPHAFRPPIWLES